MQNENMPTEGQNSTKLEAESALPRTTCSAVVTRYPTGCFGIDYQGSMFHWWGFGEGKVHAMLAHLRIPPQNVTWQERYYDRRFEFNDPRCYRTRPFIPKNAKSDAPT
jgi:hypothetical protein